VSTLHGPAEAASAAEWVEVELIGGDDLAWPAWETDMTFVSCQSECTSERAIITLAERRRQCF
jgi:hypothetical protein